MESAYRGRVDDGARHCGEKVWKCRGKVLSVTCVTNNIFL